MKKYIRLQTFRSLLTVISSVFILLLHSKWTQNLLSTLKRFFYKFHQHFFWHLKRLSLFHGAWFKSFLSLSPNICLRSSCCLPYSKCKCNRSRPRHSTDKNFHLNMLMHDLVSIKLSSCTFLFFCGEKCEQIVIKAGKKHSHISSSFFPPISLRSIELSLNNKKPKFFRACTKKASKILIFFAWSLLLPW